MDTSLFEKIGGSKAIDRAVDLFYKKILSDDRIKHFFQVVDMEKQSRMQKAFLTFAFGGSNTYKGRMLRDAHERLVKEKGLNDSHFDAVIEHLASTLKNLGISEDLTKEAVAIAESARNDVLCK